MIKRKKRKILKFLVYGLLILFFLLVISTAVLFAYYAKDLPSAENLPRMTVSQSTKIFDRTGQVLLYEIHGEVKRTLVKLDQIPKHVVLATLAIEDNDFYDHIGLRIKSILRAFWQNLKNKNIKQGGSTITQQLIKNSYLSPEKTWSRKIKEAILSIELEYKYPKDKILELYLNYVSFGSNAYGIEAASQTFFNKHVWQISLAEAAALAALPKAPTYYSPYGSHFNEFKKRQEYILDRMAILGYINETEAKEAKKEKLHFSNIKTGIKAPHFVMYIRELLSENYSEDYIERAGLNIYTTLDWKLQEEAEKIIYEGALENEKKYRAKNAALTAIDPETGEILAMVGSRDYFDLENDGNVNVAVSLRQPGSAFKPFAYAAAFQKGFTPNTVLFDLETEFNPECVLSEKNPEPKNDETCYHPQNYDGRFRGPVTMRQGLAQSLNLPSVKTLYLAGIDNTIDLAEKMGINTLKDRSRFGLSLVLGAAEVKLLEITSAYGVFAAEGKKVEPTGILMIKDKKGNIIEEHTIKKHNVLDAEIARLINDILSDNNARTPIFGAQSPLYFPDRQVAAKTGTTQNNYDAWVVGYTPQIAVGVWVGNNRNDLEIDRKGAGISAAGPIWHKFMEFALKEKPALEFTKPEIKTTGKLILDGSWYNEEIIKIDQVSKLLATAFTPPDLIKEKIIKEVHSILYYIDKNNPLGPKPANPLQDPQFLGWETAVLKWLENTGKADEFNFEKQLPAEYDNMHTFENLPKIKIIEPSPNQTFYNPEKIYINFEIESKYNISEVDFFLDDKIILVKNKPPYPTTVAIPQTAVSGEHILKIKVYDELGNRSEKEILIFFQN